jgi:hypothetical protein
MAAVSAIVLVAGRLRVLTAKSPAAMFTSPVLSHGLTKTLVKKAVTLAKSAVFSKNGTATANLASAFTKSALSSTTVIAPVAATSLEAKATLTANASKH